MSIETIGDWWSRRVKPENPGEIHDEIFVTWERVGDAPVEREIGFTDPAGNQADGYVLEPRHPMSQRFHDILDECKVLHDKKQKDYGRDSDPFANVRGSVEWDMPAWVGAMIRAHDKIRRLQQYAQKGHLENEGVEDAFMDLINYTAIAYVLWEEAQK